MPHFRMRRARVKRASIGLPTRSLGLLWCFVALLGTLDVAAQQIKHWVGGSGEWSDAAHWSLVAAGPGGAGAPRSDESAMIAPTGGACVIRVTGNVAMATLTVDARHAAVTMDGDGQMRLVGDLELRGSVNWRADGPVEMVANRGIITLDLRGIPLAADLVFEGNATWSMLSDLVLTDDRTVELRKGTLVTNGNLLRAGHLSIRPKTKLMAGSSVVALKGGVMPDVSRSVVDPGTSHLVVDGAAVGWGPEAMPIDEAFREVNLCGTGLGQVPFTITAALVSNYNGFGVSCHGQCDGAVGVTVTGGVGPFTYGWVGGPAAATWNTACPGNQIVIVTDVGQGVSCATTVQVTDPALLSVIFFGNTSPTCATVCDGTSNVFAVGGVPVYGYSWNNGAGTGPGFNQLCPGANTLHVSDANGCAFDTIFNFNVLPITGDLTVTDAQCAGECNGAAELAAAGGTGSFTYDWGPGTPVGDGTTQIGQLCPGNYFVQVTDVNGCDTTFLFQIDDPPAIDPHKSSSDASCFGTCDGTASVAPTGAAGPFTFAWLPSTVSGQGTATASGLCVGIYSVTITDQGTGCDTTVQFAIQSPTAIVPHASSTDALCATSCDGTASVAPTGGTPGYTYLWSPSPPSGQGTPQVTLLCHGNWSVTITDQAGCDTIVQFVIDAPAPIVPNPSQTDVTCAGSCNGSATVAPTGGTLPFTYLWTPAPPNGQGSVTASQLCAGPWSVLITDGHGCDTTVQFVIATPLPLTAAGAKTNITCGNACDGTAGVSVSGGTPNYTYIWSPAPGGGQGTPLATGLCAGTYSVLITDGNGCQITRTFNILPAVPMQLDLQLVQAGCPSSCDGEATVVVTGGVAGYTYLWSPFPPTGQGTAHVTGLCEQNWTLTVTDAVGCDTTISFTITAPPSIIPNATVTDDPCFGSCDGSIVLMVAGGSGGYGYSWNPAPPNGDGTAQATGLCAGIYQVQITSGICDTTVSFTVGEPDAIDAGLSLTDASCSDGCDGTATANPSGGAQGFTYNWSPAPGGGQGTSSATGLCAGAYTLQITDAAGCDTTILFNIDAPPPVAPVLSITDASCGGACDGVAILNVSGGTPGYVYLWNPAPASGQGTPIASGLCPGSYTVTVTDAAGCDTTLQFTVEEPAPIAVIATVTDANCFDACDGTISLATTGGLPPYSWTWIPQPPIGQGTANVSGLCPGIWSVLVGDLSGCDTMITFVVGAPAAIVPNGSYTDETCAGPCDGTATVAPAGGDGVFTYLWTPDPAFGQGTPSVSGLCDGPWSVTITDGHGCDTTWTFSVDTVAPVTAVVTTVKALCWDSCTAEATVVATGGVGGYTYFWSPEPAIGQGTATISGLCTGAWTVTVTDSAGCDTTIAFMTSKFSMLVPGLTVMNETCGGPCTGSATANSFGGSGFYDYFWSPAPGGGQGTPNATGLCAGTTYSLTLSDSNNCDTTLAFTVQPYAAIASNVIATAESCIGSCDGAATASPSGGQGPFTYLWFPTPAIGQGQPQVSGLCAGLYQVTITDVNGCDTTVTFTIGSPTPIDAGAVIQNIGCHGACDGTIVLNVTGGIGAYNYVWTPTPAAGQGTAQASGLCPGDQSVTITDGQGCDTTFTFTILEPLVLTDSATIAGSHCGICDGSVQLHPAGGTGPYSFTWGPPLNITTTDSLITGLCAGLYSVTITDASGCSIQHSVAVADEDGDVLTTTGGVTTCPNSCDGSVAVSYVCGVDPCVVAWSDLLGNDLGQNTDTVNGLCIGGYIVTLTNGSGCVSIDTAMVVPSAPITASITSSPVNCAAACDGSATLVLSGGTGGFTILWTPAPASGQGTTHASGLCPGSYDILVHDIGGCDTTFTVVITAPLPLVVTPAIADISCAGACDAQVALNVQGGTGPFTYLWAPAPAAGQGTSTASGLCAGGYVVNVSDAHGCDTTLAFTITDPMPLAITGSTTPSHCLICDGTTTLVVSGGTGPVTVTWTDSDGNDAGTGEVLTGVCAGIYVAHATDAHGCSSDLVLVVPDATGDTLTATDGITLCANSCDGMVSVSYSCSSLPCVVTWFDMSANTLLQGSDTLAGLCVGSYLVQVENGDGCLSFDTAMVVPSDVIVPNLSTTPVSCIGACDGTATIAPAGGAAPYTYLWSPAPGSGQGTAAVTGLCAGPYTVVVSDSLGCDTTYSVLITAPSPIILDAQITDVACGGSCDGSIILAASGGNGFFAYTWSPVPPNGQGSNGAFSLCPGDWSVTVTDINGCDTTITYTILGPDTLAMTVNTTLSTCGVCNGTASVEVTGGTAPYVTVWTENGVILGSDSLITGLCAGLYTITITDAHGCSIEQQVPISDVEGELVTTTDHTLTCPGLCDGVVTAAFNCVEPVCTVAWFDATGIDLGVSVDTLSGLCAGTYFVQVTNGLGCITIDTASVITPDPIQANLNTTPVSCAGNCDGTATVGPTGGSGGYTYVWSPGTINGQGTSVVTDLCAGDYEVLIADSLGCSVTQAVLIDAPLPLSAVSVVDPVSCNGSCDGSIMITTQGGNGEYSYNWSPVPPNGQGTAVATELCADVWSVTITDINGCDTTLTFTLTDPPTLVADVTHTDDPCFNTCAGTAQIDLSGGVAPYEIDWMNAAGDTVAHDLLNLTDLCGGTYSVMVADSNGCQILIPFTIGQGEAIEANLIFHGETCNGPCDGVATVAPTGGSGTGYTYFWQPEPPNGQGTTTATDLCVGNWSVSITDGGGCDTTYYFNVLPFTPLNASAIIDQPSCNGSCNGSIDLAVAGGIIPYTYSWSPEPPLGQGTATADSLCAGSWTVVITDSVGCDTTFTFTIIDPPVLAVTTVSVTSATCNMASDGAIDLSISGGTPGYLVAWVGPNGFVSSDEDISNIFPGNYIVVVTDLSGCQATLAVVVGELTTVVAVAGPDMVECYGITLVLDGSASQGAASFQWSDELGNVIDSVAVHPLNDLSPGTHAFMLSVANGVCTDTDTVLIQVLALPLADAGPDQTLYVEGSLVVGGSPSGQEGSTFAWQPDSLFDHADGANPTVTLDVTTWLVLQVTDPDGCVSVDSMLVTVEPEVKVPSGFSPNGDGYNDVWVLDFVDLFPDLVVDVYNRWGEPLFHSVGYTVPWDGRYNGGVVPVGTYYYVIELHDPRFPEALTGPLTVIR